MSLIPITPAAARKLVELGSLLVDIREEEDRGRAPIAGSLHAPLSELPRRIGGQGVPAVVFFCATGEATRAQGDRLVRVAATGLAFRVEGGLAALCPEPPPATLPRSLPNADQSLVLLLGAVIAVAAVLGLAVSPGFFGVHLALGIVLLLAGHTGRWNRARLLKRTAPGRTAPA